MEVLILNRRGFDRFVWKQVQVSFLSDCTEIFWPENKMRGKATICTDSHFQGKGQVFADLYGNVRPVT